MRKSYPNDVSREQFEKIRCMVPECGGMIKYEKKNTIEEGVMVTLVRQNNSVEQYKIVKRA